MILCSSSSSAKYGTKISCCLGTKSITLKKKKCCFPHIKFRSHIIPGKLNQN
jgi:hypothetical protein